MVNAPHAPHDLAPHVAEYRRMAQYHKDRAQVLAATCRDLLTQLVTHGALDEVTAHDYAFGIEELSDDRYPPAVPAVGPTKGPR